MQYEAYENKIKKVASVLAIIWRHIVLIILCIAAVVGLTVAVVALKGTILSVKVREEFVYGEKLDLKGTALFSRVKFEFSSEGSDWTEEQPTMPGEYKARAFCTDSFGSRNYGEEFVFTISKVKLEIGCLEDVLVYGDSFTPSVKGLVDGDSVKNLSIYVEDYKEALDYYYNTDGKTIVGTAIVMPDIKNLIIVNSDGMRVNDAYDIVLDRKEVMMLPLSTPLRLEAESHTGVYDGHPLVYNGSYNITQGRLVNGDTVYTDNNTYSISRVGEIGVTLDNVKIFDSKGRDVTFLYDIITINGTLKMTPRPLHIETESAEFTYDGDVHRFLEHTVLEGSLASGDKLNIMSSTTVKTVSEDGAPYNNEVYFSISNGENKDVTSNYELKVDYGTITVNKCPIRIQTGSSEKEYDGKPLSNSYAWILSTTELTEHRVTIFGNPTATWVGSVENTCDTWATRIRAENGEDVTDNFIFEGYEYGTLRIKQGPVLFVAVYPTEKTYSGKKISLELSDVCVPIAEGRVSIDYSKIDLALTDAGVITLEMLNSLSELCYAEIDGVEYPVKFVTPNGDTDPNYAVLTVVPKSLQITAVTKVFNYKEGAVYTSNDVNISRGSLADGHTVTAKCNGVIKCTEDLEDGYAVDNFITHCQIVDEYGIDVTNNYQIALIGGLLRVMYYDDI